MAADDAAKLLSYLVGRHRRAGNELDDLRRRGLEMIIAACVTELNIPARFGRSVSVDPTALSEADIAARRRSTAPVVNTPDRKEAEPLPPEPDEADGGWDWLTPDVPDEIDEDMAVLEPEPETTIEEPRVPERIRDPFDEPPPPPPPVSPEPAVEDVRGAWDPPKDG